MKSFLKNIVIIFSKVIVFFIHKNFIRALSFFTPTSRLKLALSYTNHISQLAVYNDEKNKLIQNVFIRGLTSSTLGYRSLLKNESICEHYYIEPRNMGLAEMLKIGFDFSTQFFSQADYINKVSFYKIRFLFVVISDVTTKIFRKLNKKVFKS